MVRLRQVSRPAEKATWNEYFYAGELKVVNGEVETDNENWVHQLLARGFKIVGDEPEAEAKEPEVYAEPALVPQPVLDELPPTPQPEVEDADEFEALVPEPSNEPSPELAELMVHPRKPKSRSSRHIKE